MKIVTGNPVRGDDFFDREQELEEIWSTLQGDSILLAAPRRVGKTSIMLRLVDQPKNFKVLFLDAQDYSEPEDLITDLTVKAGKLLGDPKRLFKSVLSKVDELGIWQLRVKFKQQLTDRWQDVGQQAIEAVVKSGPTLLIVDELTMLLHKLMTDDPSAGARNAADLMDWLRHLRHEPSLAPSLRQVLGGSIGLPRIASYLKCSAKINDIVPVEIGPLSREHARELGERLLAVRHVALSPDLLEVFLDQVETFLPVLVQIMASAVAWEAKKIGGNPTAELIRSVYEERALGGSHRLAFEDYYERLQRYYTPTDARAARRILRDLAHAPQGLSRGTIEVGCLNELGTASSDGLDMLLTWLSDDFYLQQRADGGYAFKSRWLRDWWERYHGGR